MHDLRVVVGVLRTLVTAALVSTSVEAHAQIAPEPGTAPEGRFQVGSHLSVTPAIAFVTGHDSNFIRTTNGEPANEYYIVPQIEGWLGRGRVRVNFGTAVEYNKESGNGVWNRYYFGRLDMGTGRVFVNAFGSHRNHYAPPTDFVGFELGIKSRRVENMFEANVGYRPGGRVSFGAVARKAQLRYDAAEQFEGNSLQFNLNRDSDSFGGSVAMAITPLTSAAASLEATRDRFLFASERDGNGYRALGGVQFQPIALLNGRAQVGFMRYTTLQTRDVYGGPTYYLGVTLDRGPILLDVSGSRVIDFSFDPSRGFYVSTGLDVYSVVQLGRVWDVFARGSWRQLSPQGPISAEQPFRGIELYKGGLAYRLGQRTRVGTEGERYIYGGPGGIDGVRVTVFVTYGSNRLQRLDRPLPGEF